MDERLIPKSAAWAIGFYVETENPNGLSKVIAYAKKQKWSVTRVAHSEFGSDVSLPNGETLAPGGAFEHARKLRELPGVSFAEPTFSYRNDLVADPGSKEEALRATYILGMDRPELPTDWHLTLLRIPEARTRFKTMGKGITVGHPDTGYTRHPEVFGRTDAAQGRDFLEGDNDPLDPLLTTRPFNIYNPGHGTGTGSLIVSPPHKQDGTEGERGVEGVAPEATLIPLRVTPLVAMTNTRNLADAIWYAVDKGIRVVSVSLGAPFPDRRTERVLERARAEGVLVCVAAGNVVRFVTYPGSSPLVLTVAGCTFEQDPWFDSCRGSAVDVTAGAASVWVAHTEEVEGVPQYKVGQGGGTSFAVATVAGLAALWLSHHGWDALAAKYGKENIVEVFHRLLRKTANTRGKSYFASGKWGAGIPDAVALFNERLPDLATLRSTDASMAHTLAATNRLALDPTNPKEILRNLADSLGDTVSTSLSATDSVDRHRRTIEQLLGGDAPLDLQTELAFHLSVDPKLRMEYTRAVAEGDSDAWKRLRKGLSEAGSPRLREALSQASESSRLSKSAKVETAKKPFPSPGTDPLPAFRRIRVYAFDPSLATQTTTQLMSEATLKIPWEEALDVGPIGEYLEVIDVDPASGCFYNPVDLNRRDILAQDGLSPSEGNPQFHQQMVYAVGMETIQNFERALGRKILWRELDRDDLKTFGLPEKENTRYVQRLRIYPHALREANAYYSQTRRAILMGYFPAPSTQTEKYYPNGLVFSCLSQDIIAHEMTHAILDGLHPRFAEPTNLDVLAFHEGFADLVALLQRFSQADVLKHIIARTRGDLGSTENLLGQLAQQFGRVTGHDDALRSYVGRTANPTLLNSATEPHERGAVLVAAIYDAFVTIYKVRIADLLRLATDGSGVLKQGALQPDLVNRLAEEAAKAAGHVLTICIRALNYCPPVDITFGDYLRALITADFEHVRDDDRGYRVAFIEAFRRWGIYPSDVRTLSEDSLRWQPFDTFAPLSAEPAQILLREAFKALEQKMPSFRDPTRPRADRYRLWTESRGAAGFLHNFLVPPGKSGENAVALRALGLEVDDSTDSSPLQGKGKIEVHSVRSLFRVLPGGEIQSDLRIELTQWRRFAIDPEKGIDPDDVNGSSFKIRGGITIVYNRDSDQIRYVIRKNFLSQERERRQRAFLENRANLAASTDYNASQRALYFSAEEETEPFALIHRGGR